MHGPEIGPHGSYAARVVMPDGDVPTYEYGSRGHVSAWVAGASSALAGEARRNPYAGDRLDTRGRIALGRRGFRNAWARGYDGTLEALKRIAP